MKILNMVKNKENIRYINFLEKKKKKDKERRKSSIRIKGLKKKSDSLTALGIELSQVKQDLEELQRDMEVDAGIIRRSRGSMSAQCK